MQSSKIKKMHIAIIIIGSIFISLSIFHENLWFDESYSIAIAKQSFKNIWIIGSNDVHPILYYWILHIIGLVTNNSVYAMRLFSIIPIIVTSILGYTMVRKDYDQKTGLLFSLFTFFMPMTLPFVGEIRMYSLGMMLVIITFLYAHRIIKETVSTTHETMTKEENKKEPEIEGAAKNSNKIFIKEKLEKEKLQAKNIILLMLFTLLAAYTHYYALIAVFIIDVITLIKLIIACIKNKDIKKSKKNLIAYICGAVVVIALYIPWLLNLLRQTESVSHGFWITTYPLEVFVYLVTGISYKSEPNQIIQIALIVVSVLALVYLVIAAIKNIKNEKRFILPLSIFIIEILIVTAVKFIIGTDILVARYLFNLAGLSNLAIAIILKHAIEKNAKMYQKIFCAVFIIVMVGISTWQNVLLIKENYSSLNNKPNEYIKNQIGSIDVIATDTSGAGFVIISKYKDEVKETYFLNYENWGVEEAYKCYGETVNFFEDIKNIENSRICLIVSEENFEKIKENNDINLIEHKTFSTDYHDYHYNIYIVTVNSTINKEDND